MQKSDKALDYSKKQNGIAIEDYHITKEPFYLTLGDEVLVFEAALKLKLPVMLKGPTGCGKTRFLCEGQRNIGCPHISWIVFP